MRVVIPTFLILIGAGALWVAYTGKTVYYGGPGAHSDDPMPPRLGRFVSAFVGVVALFLAVWILFHQK